MAARDVVARAISSEIAAGRKVFLDTREAVGTHFPDHFPTVFSVCMTAGIDPRTACIPVAPAAHYHMGGVATDMWGRTTLEGLSACGECASSGAHGANRLASNSLLEAVVFADRIATRIKAGASRTPRGEASAEAATYMPSPALKRLRTAMSLKAGVTREAQGLQDVLILIDELQAKHGEAFPLISARLIASAALAREESRGGHYRKDFPNLGTQAVRTFLSAPR
jgi:L-aspartate oxidase